MEEDSSPKGGVILRILVRGKDVTVRREMSLRPISLLAG